jgi:aldehyde dehydrogenase (NAD+)
MASVVPEPGSFSIKIDDLFNLQHEHFGELGRRTAKQRKRRLKELLKAIIAHKEEIEEAIHSDFGRLPTETALIEIYPLVTQIRHIISNLSQWMRPQYVGAPIMMLGTRSRILWESKGMVLIISPWNFPLLLTLGPLAHALAAGNSIVLKPSEMTPASTAVIVKIVNLIFPPEEVGVIEGGKDITTTLLQKAFHHIMFTGSPKVGKVIMAAAAKNLTSLTLELGGKSPTIIGPKANLKLAATRIAWAKGINAGQVCLAPDYVMIHESKKEEFLKLIQMAFDKHYPKNGEDMADMINQEHYNRVSEYLPKADSEGTALKLSHAVFETSDHSSDVLNDEIFGPLLPVVTYKNEEDILSFVNSRPRPLAMYLFSNDSKWYNSIIDNTRSGAVCINHNVLHFFNPELPFGGINNSGMGRNHGKAGFETFSNARGELKQIWPFSIAALVYPPFNTLKKRLIDFLIRYI